MIDTLLNLVFRCAHRRLTRPVTPVKRGDPSQGETYVVCLDCGKQFSYDPKLMRIGKALENGAGAVPARADTVPAATRLVRAAAAAIPAAIMFLMTLFRVKRNPSK